MNRGVRTEWHLAELSSGEADPFAHAVYSVGLDVDLGGSEEELAAALRATLDREGRLWKGGLTCDLKDGGQDCRTCPLATLETSEPRARLCRLGKDQFAIADRLKVFATERVEARQEVADVADELSEVGHLDADLAELLTAVGL